MIILDIMMPGQDGIAVCKYIRKKYDVPVIFLTALNQEQDIVNGYEVGADEYVTKPVSMPILVAKMNALIKRYRGLLVENGIIRIDALQIELARRLVTFGDWKRNVELNAEAKAICEQIFSDYINKIDTMDYQVEQGIFTCYVGITGYISDEYAMPYVYVFHPIEIAMSELVDIYCLAILFGISVIGIIWFSIGKVCNQVRRERN